MKQTIAWIKAQEIREARIYNGDIYVSLQQDDTACSDSVYKIDRRRKSVEPVNYITYKFGTNGTNGIYRKSNPVDIERLKSIL